MLKKFIQLSTFGFLLLILGVSQGYGAQYDLKEMTPAIEKAISSRQARYGIIQELLDQKSLGENNRGYVEVFIPSSRTYTFSEGENADRKIIYQAIADQNHLGSAGLKTIESVFAEVKREKASDGHKIQLPSGEWTTK